MEIGDAGQLFELDAVGRIDVGLGLALEHNRHRQLLSGLPRHGALLGQHLGKISKEGHAPEGIT